MELIFDGLQNLTGKILPNVTIEDIFMSTAPDPSPESNPHIQSTREIVSTGISGNKQVQQSSFSSQIANQQIQNKNFYLDITLSILNAETFVNSLILKQMNYLDFIYVKVIQSLSKALTDELLSSNFEVDVSALKNASDYTEKIFKLSDFLNNKKTEFLTKEANVYKHINKVRFTSKNPQKQYLDVFTYVYVDIQQLINQYELNLTSKYQVLGNVSKENVIAESKTNTQSYVLTDQNNKLFVGNPIKVTSGKFVTKTPTLLTKTTTMETLNLVPVTNKKIRDLRGLEQLNVETITNLKKPVQKNNLTKSFVPEQSYLSELYTTREKSGVCSSLFMFDIISYLKNKSNTPEIYDNVNVLSYINIKKLSLYRKRVKTINSTVYTFDEYTPDKLIISTSEKSFGNIVNKFSFYDNYNNIYTTSLDQIKNGNFGSTIPNFATVDTLKKIASITEIFLPNVSNHRVFTFTDYEIASLTTGEYQYYIEVEIQDQTSILFENKIDLLNAERNKLLSYLSESERADMFSANENKQTEKFIKLQKEKYKSVDLNTAVKNGSMTQTITIQNAPWISAPSVIVSIEKESLNPSLQHSDKIKLYYNQLNPSTTNPTNVKYVVDKVDSLISQLRTKYSLDEKQDKNTISNRTNTIKSTIIAHTFNNVFDSEIAKVGIDFLDIPKSDPADYKIGLPKILKSSFDIRINNEINKYFPATSPIDLSSLSDSLSIEEQDSLSDISSYSTCYLSPSSAILDTNQTIKLDSIDSSNLNLSTYDTVVNKSISSNNRKDKSVSNELLTKTSLAVSTTKDFASNLTTTVQLSFITKPSLLSDASTIFSNSGFNSVDRNFTLQEICELSNLDSVNDETLLQLAPLTNAIMDSIIRPSSINDTANQIVSILTIDKLNVKSDTSILNDIKSQQIVSNKLNSTQSTISQKPNVISSKAGITSAKITVQNDNILATIPLQTKSLMLDTTTKTKFQLSSFGFDPFLNPSTKNFMRLNFQNICQIEYLAGFENENLKNPIWKLLSKKDYDSLSGLIAIRTKQYVNKLYNIGTETGLTFNVYNEFSILDKGDVQPMKPTLNTQTLFPNITLNINNKIINTDNLLNVLSISSENTLQNEITKQLIVANTIDAEIKSSYTFSKLELDNVNK